MYTRMDFNENPRPFADFLNTMDWGVVIFTLDLRINLGDMGGVRGLEGGLELKPSFSVNGDIILVGKIQSLD